jgi:sugar lactone lactonase YvrE
MKNLPIASAIAFAAALSACGGGGGGGAAGTSAGAPAPVPVATIQLSGTVRNLSGSGLMLSNNGERVEVTPGATAFSFPTKLAADATYRLAITVHPNGQLCEVSSATGTAASVSQGAIVVDCKSAVVTTLAGKQAEGETYTGPGMQVSVPSPASIGFDAAGNLYFTNSQVSAIRKLDPSNQVSFLAGHLNAVGRPAYGMDDGPAALATFSSPYSLTVDARGTIYVADYGRIRTVGPDGTVSTIAGSDNFGQADGRGAAASFPGSEMRLAAAPDGSVYAIEVRGSRIRKVSPDGTVTTLAAGAAAGGAGFQSLLGMTVGGDGSIYVIDNGSVHKISPLGAVSTVFAMRPATGCGPQEGIGVHSTGVCTTRQVPVNGPKEVATLASPQGLAVDAKGKLFIADTYNGMIRVMTPEGGVSTLVGTGALSSADGPGATATAILPVSVALDGKGNVVFAEAGSGVIGTYPKLRRISFQ